MRQSNLHCVLQELKLLYKRLGKADNHSPFQPLLVDNLAKAFGAGLDGYLQNGKSLIDASVIGKGVLSARTS